MSDEDPIVVAPTAEELAATARLRALRTRQALGQAPELAQHIRGLVSAADGRGEAGAEIRMQRTPLKTGVTDDADEVYVRVSEWVEYWSETLNVPATRARGTRNHQDAHPGADYQDAPLLGFYADTTPGQALLLVRMQTMWLLAHDDQITAHPAAEKYQADITSLVWGLRARHKLTQVRERDVIGRACDLCHQPAVHITWQSEELTDVDIRCEHCGLRYEVVRPSDIEGWLGDSTRSPRVVSRSCQEDEHEDCPAMACECPCHYQADPVLSSEWLTIPTAATRVKRSWSAIERWIADGLAVTWQKGVRYIHIDDLLRTYREQLAAPKGGKGTPRRKVT